MVSSGSGLARLYNDRSVLENYHSLLIFSIMSDHRYAFLPSSSAEVSCRAEAPNTSTVNCQIEGTSKYKEPMNKR